MVVLAKATHAFVGFCAHGGVEFMMVDRDDPALDERAYLATEVVRVLRGDGRVVRRLLDEARKIPLYGCETCHPQDRG
jgi:hypothetical protein